MNQPAFPVVTRDTYDDDSNKFGHQFSTSTWQYPGITVRDYFAAKAMQGWFSTYPDDRGTAGVDVNLVADFAYRMADAMMKARNN